MNSAPPKPFRLSAVQYLEIHREISQQRFLCLSRMGLHDKADEPHSYLCDVDVALRLVREG